MFDYIEFLNEKLIKATDEERKNIEKELEYLNKLFVLKDAPIKDYIEKKTYQEQLRNLFKNV